jgi:hypothetical protein
VTGFKTVCLIFIVASRAFAQDSVSYQWKSVREWNINEDAIWTVDMLGNLYVSSHEVLTKYDSTGKLKFSQSIKSLGHLQRLQVINTMKIVAFSEEQQTLCFFDNTLTLNENCLDLSTYSIGLATDACTSSQPDRGWIVDQLNNTLLQINFRLVNQYQEVKNIRGILDMSGIIAMKEANNSLYIFDTNYKLYQFDIYGTLVNVFQMNPAIDFNIRGSDCILLQPDRLIFYNLASNQQFSVSLPEIDSEAFNISGDFFYFRMGNKLIKYTLKL